MFQGQRKRPLPPVSNVYREMERVKASTAFQLMMKSTKIWLPGVSLDYRTTCTGSPQDNKHAAFPSQFPSFHAGVQIAGLQWILNIFSLFMVRGLEQESPCLA